MSQINISNLTFEYDGSYDRIFDNVSFTIDTNWRLGFIGRNGRGKTTFLKLLMGSYEYRGTITANVGFEYFPFDVRDSSPTATTLDIAYKICPYLEQWELERELDLMDFDTDKLFTPYKIMSPGEQTKLMLAVLFLKENRFLLIDEPTNHLDSFSRRIVSDYLKSKKGFILVSHDRNFVDNCVDHILSINRSNIELQQGNFSSWYENKTRQDTFEL
ncbi:ABC-F family ATP-binding cassette domain-containing protein, partial [Candidatus Nomurabacteria bacterium]|nr:ABC-F family ATP-binding cassette domain-containing protein [Candidatus Nomurabacteria bacterium]